MSVATDRSEHHKHTAVKTLVLEQRKGVPYAVERTFCYSCQRVLDERKLKRTAA
jgi:hypothetical protein